MRGHEQLVVRSRSRRRPCIRAGAAGGAHPRDAGAAARGDRRVPGRARVQPHLDHARLRAGRGEPGRAAASLPDQERPRGRGGRARDRGPCPRSWRGRRAAADRPAAHPCGAADARRPRHLADLHRRARAVGGGAHRPGRCWPRSRRWSRRSAARRTGAPSTCSAPTSRCRACASSSRPPSTWSAASASPTPSPTTPAAGPASWTAGRSSSTRPSAGARHDAPGGAARRPGRRGRAALRAGHRRPRRRGLDHLDPRTGLEHRHPGRPPGLDRRARPARRRRAHRRRRPRLGRGGRRALRDPASYVDTGAHELARLVPAALLARWDRARADLDAALRAPRGAADALVPARRCRRPRWRPPG